MNYITMPSGILQKKLRIAFILIINLIDKRVKNTSNLTIVTEKKFSDTRNSYHMYHFYKKKRAFNDKTLFTFAFDTNNIST